MKSKTTKIIFAGIALVFAGLFFSNFSLTGSVVGVNQGIDITVYKSLNCGCCEGFIGELKDKGFNTDVKVVNNIATIKNKYNIPAEMQSCHTSVIEGYFIEGHVPLEAIEKLLEERPNIDGIILPGMPSGSAGMPGQKKEPFVIYALSNGELTEFMVI